MDADMDNQNQYDIQPLPTDKNTSRRFNKLIKKVTVMPQRLDSQLPLEPVFEPATDLHPNLLKANPKLYMLEDYFSYTSGELEHCASKVGISDPVSSCRKRAWRSSGESLKSSESRAS